MYIPDRLGINNNDGDTNSLTGFTGGYPITELYENKER
jgi:hypothetical protein